MILALTSRTRTASQLYDLASNVLQQHLSQIPGVGEVEIGGSSLPAVRVEMNPLALYKFGIGFEDIRAALASANAIRPKALSIRVTTGSSLIRMTRCITPRPIVTWW